MDFSSSDDVSVQMQKSVIMVKTMGDAQTLVAN